MSAPADHTAALQPLVSYGKLPAQDLERARRFYEQTLGVRPFTERGEHLYYDVGGNRFMLFRSDAQASGEHDQLGFVVADLKGAVETLRGAGITPEPFPGTVDGIADFGPVRACWFKDTEGNLLNLIEGQSPLWSS